MSTPTSTPVTDGEALEEFEDLVIQAIKIREQGDSVDWDIGELADELPTNYGKNVLAQFADRVGYREDWVRAANAGTQLVL